MNDLILLRYGWGHRPGDGSGLTDCFQLCCEVRRRMGLCDHAAQFAWVYEQYDEHSFPRMRIARWLLKLGRRLDDPQPGAAVLLPGLDGAALGTATDHGVIYISPRQTVVHAPIPAGMGRFFWLEQ